MPKETASRERCFGGVREVLNAMKVNRTLLCERESLTADVAELVPICTPSAKETLGMFFNVNSDIGGRRPRKEVASEGWCQRYNPQFLYFQPV